MSRLSFWSRRWQGWTRTSFRRPCARRHAAGGLEALEPRLNLAAVVVVETVDAYWFIEEPTLDSLAPAASADQLLGSDVSGSAGFDQLEQGLPNSITPVAANGGALNPSEAKLTDSFLTELWSSEPDFFYEDVLAVTFYNDTSTDTLINSGLFDGSDQVDSFSNTAPSAGDVVGNSGVANNIEKSLGGQQNLAIGRSMTANKPNSAAAVGVNETVSSELFASAKAEVAAWSKRLESESLVQANGGQAFANEAWAAVTIPSRSLAADQISTKVLPLSSRNDSPRDSTVVPAVAATTASQETVTATEMTKLESFFAKFPSFGFGASRSSMLRFVRDNGDAHTAKASDGNDPVVDETTNSLSYSQWASLIGAVSLLGASQWRSGGNDRRETQTTPLRAKVKGERPVAC